MIILTIWSCDVEVGNIYYPHQEKPRIKKGLYPLINQTFEQKHLKAANEFISYLLKKGSISLERAEMCGLGGVRNDPVERELIRTSQTTRLQPFPPPRPKRGQCGCVRALPR